MEVLRRCPLAIAQRLVHCAIALSTAVLDRVTKTMSVAPLLMNNLDNPKQKTSNLLSPAPPPYSWSLLGKSEGPAPPPSSKIFWSRLEPCQLWNDQNLLYVSPSVLYTCSGPWPFNLFFPVLFLFDWVGVLWAQLSKVLKVVCWAGEPRRVPGEIKRS